jgi:hypothetical protein
MKQLRIEQFIPRAEMSAIRAGLVGEESAYFSQAVRSITATITEMPRTYGQDGKGDGAIAFLHYFSRGSDWYITELDVDDDHEGQHQAYGFAILNGDMTCAEMGYISIAELVTHGVELDLHFKPTTIGQIKAKKADRSSNA